MAPGSARRKPRPRCVINGSKIGDAARMPGSSGNWEFGPSGPEQYGGGEREQREDAAGSALNKKFAEIT